MKSTCEARAHQAQHQVTGDLIRQWRRTAEPQGFGTEEEEEEEVPSESKKISKQSVSIVNPTPILPALCTDNNRKGTAASILNLSFQAGLLSKMHAYRHIPAQTRLEITLSGTSYILHV